MQPCKLCGLLIPVSRGKMDLWEAFGRYGDEVENFWTYGPFCTQACVSRWNALPKDEQMAQRMGIPVARLRELRARLDGGWKTYLVSGENCLPHSEAAA